MRKGSGHPLQINYEAVVMSHTDKRSKTKLSKGILRTFHRLRVIPFLEGWKVKKGCSFKFTNKVIQPSWLPQTRQGVSTKITSNQNLLGQPGWDDSTRITWFNQDWLAQPREDHQTKIGWVNKDWGPCTTEVRVEGRWRRLPYTVEEIALKV